MENFNEIKERVKAIACEHLSIDEENFDENLDFKEDYGFDSLDFFAVLNQIEDEFGIALETDEVVELNTFRKLMDYIEKSNMSRV